MVRSILLLMITVSLTGMIGCGAHLTSSGKMIRFVDQPDLVAGCEALGQVRGSSWLGGFVAAKRQGKERAEVEMRNKAAELGADVVFVQVLQGGFMGGESLGDAYRCGSQTPGSAAQKIPPTEDPSKLQAGCVKDADCKGDRICEAGKCVKP